MKTLAKQLVFASIFIGVFTKLACLPMCNEEDKRADKDRFEHAVKRVLADMK